MSTIVCFLVGMKSPAKLLDESAEASAISKQNSRLINRTFASLVRRVFSRLQHKMIDIEELKLYLFQAFSSNSLAASSLDAATTVSELFIAIARLGLWDYLDYELLERVIGEFAEGDEGLQGMLEDYQQQLSAFKLATLLETYIQFIQPENEQMQLATGEVLLPKLDPDPTFFVKLSIKTDAEISEHSLSYVYELRKRLSRFVSLPPIALVLDKIAEGCVCVTWRFPAEFSTQVVKAVRENKELVKTELGALTIVVGSEQVYHNPVEVTTK